MFFFGKKKKEKKQEQAVPVVNKEELIAKASEKVTELESKTGDERVSLLNEIGSLYTQAEETDLAIQYYEESLELCKQPNGKREAISIFGTDYDTKDGTCVRDYIHVTDLAQAHILAVKYLMEGNESNIFNLGNGVGFTVKEVIETARKVTGKPIKAVEEGRRAGDPAVLIASSEKAKNILGWKPEHADLEEIIASAWKWHSSHPQGYCSVQKEDK